jgi:fatty acid desaturase
MHIAGLRYLFGQQARRRWLELGLLGLHLVLYVGFFVHFLGPWQALMVIVIHQCCGGFYMASVFAPNHKGMERLTSGHELDFLRRQVLTSRNVRAHPLTDVWYGALNYQVEHHLFPTMARNRVPRAHTIVADFCRERDIPYHQVSVLRSWREILSYLHQVGAPLRRPGGRGAGWLSLRPRRRAG